MKSKRTLSWISITAALVLSSMTASAKNDKTEKITEYNVMTRMEVNVKPAGFTPKVANNTATSYNENVMTVTNKVLNEDSKMLKFGKVQTVGQRAAGAWQMMCDEGGADYEQSALNPLSYMLGGISSSLLTQVEHYIELLDLDVKEAKVEARVFFRYTDPMSSKWSGFADSVEANIWIESKEPAAKIAELQRLALQSWSVGECLENPTKVLAQFAYNGDIWTTEYARPGKVVGDESYDQGLKTTAKVSPMQPLTFDLAKDVPMHLTDPYIFEVVGLAQSAHDPNNPYLHKMQVRSLNVNYATWEIYADDSRNKGVESAPSSREYFSIGTSLCLMSQLTASEIFYKFKRLTKIPDYRAEHEFYFEEENTLTKQAQGHVDSVTTRILVNSKKSDKKMEAFATQSLRMCFAGDAISKATPLLTDIYLNGKVIE